MAERAGHWAGDESLERLEHPGRGHARVSAPSASREGAAVRAAPRPRAARIKFTNPPRPIHQAVYDAAAREYARRAGSRAVAIYRVGALTHVGLSDLDLIVIPRAARPDNARWFAVRSQLPRALRAPFRYDPDVLPADHVDVLRFTTHAQRELIWGDDVAAGVRCLETPEQRWSMLFERLCHFNATRRFALKHGRIDLWRLVARAKSVAISLVDTDVLTGSRHADGFHAEVEALRAGFFGLEPNDAGARFWALFNRGLRCIESTLVDALALDASTTPVAFAERFLHGEVSIPGLCETALAERRAAVLRVQRATHALGCGCGDVITGTPYLERITEMERASSPPRWQRLGMSASYAVRGARLRVEDRFARAALVRGTRPPTQSP